MRLGVSLTALGDERPLDLQALDARPVRVAIHMDGHAGHRHQVVENLIALRGSLLHERDADLVRARAHATTNVLEALVDLGKTLRLLHIHGLQILIAADASSNTRTPSTVMMSVLGSITPHR